MPLRTVALIGAACLTVGWLLASVVMPPVARVQVRPERRPAVAPPAAEPLNPHVERLHARVQRAPAPRAPRRNPFAYADRRVPLPVDAHHDATGADLDPEPAVPMVARPALWLAGIAESADASGRVRTAIISDGTTVYLAREGDDVLGYVVVDVGADAATIAGAGDERWTLRLK